VTPDTAEVLAGLVRYIENRSDARHAYAQGADSQVVAGIGHWRMLTEYADDSTFDQEIRISTVDDGVSVIWDPDAIFPNKEDARFCFRPG
jgi:Phage P22-like portal protein